MKLRSTIPLATYRLQLNHDFTFSQATSIVPYLANLGISHCYISPCLKARPGSMHGYDIVDHNSFNPEIGTAEEFDHFVKTLREHNMGLILDIVPNHMGVMGSDNVWWLDVLENGEASIYANFFDIEWHPLKEELDGKVLVAVLHDHYGAVLESGELQVVFNSNRGEFDIYYRDHRLPIDPKEYPRILKSCNAEPAPNPEVQNPDLLEFQSLITAFGHLPGRQEIAGDRVAERNRDKEIHKRRLAELCSRSSEIAACILRAVNSLNGNPADPASFEQLHELIKAQAFRLANWRVASDDINYRRFFDTNDLAGIRMENENVFQATHRFILQLIGEGKVDGLRLDHPDGLYDPAQYFEHLRNALSAAQGSDAAGSKYVVIEKILTGSERLPSDWPVDGTTGYDYANLVNGLFVDAASAGRLERIYRSFVDDDETYEEIAYRSRKLIVQVPLASELSVLANQLARIALSRRRTCDFTLNSLRAALTEVVSSFPVYRTYVSPSRVSDNDVRYISNAVDFAKWRSPAADTSIFEFIREVLLTSIAEGQGAAYRSAATAFAMKFQQFTSPVMAKGLEDTAFYRYNRLVSLNEVGGDLRRFGTTPDEFHEANLERMRLWPNTMIATSTHDSKRSEDVRARINVLSEISGQWRLRVRDWRRFNRSHKRTVNDQLSPSPNDEYLFYQTLVGAWPLPPLSTEDDWTSFSDRMESYMLKAIREAKENTSWINRNTEYEAAVSSFVRALLNSASDNRFLNDFVPFQRRIARIGMWNSLSQTLLKLTCPGVPDIYQGTELWDLSLVDPDNRRPVDYSLRQTMFGCLRQSSNTADTASIARLLAAPEDGRLKLHLIWRTLCLRQGEAELFQRGEYVPLRVNGAKAEHVIAFCRKSGTKSVLIVVPRLIASLLDDSDLPPTGTQVWEDTAISLPVGTSKDQFRNAITGEKLSVDAEMSVSALLSEFPVAICILE
jgi:(1->4)-alpha-D-glucan 1-alpha-D-glucosylmutase